ncbi:MAG: twin-arginine translocase subunit TatB [Gammaproteobacteria bacterium]|nr:MAG: twin-arginine translocase subunit TatB [Gammaproteobacteria bacterium]
MFDINFSELAVVGIVALLVIGPKRLPEVARTAGKWLGKARRMVERFRADMDREFKTDELRNLLTQQQEEMQELRKIVEETRGTLDDAGHQIESLASPDDVQGYTSVAGVRTPGATTQPATPTQIAPPGDSPPHGGATPHP